MPDPREPYGRLFHEQGRLTVNAEREKPFLIAAWPDRTAEQQEIDMRGASAVAVQAVADAKVEVDKMRATVMAAHSELARLRDRCDERDRLISALIAEHPVELGRFSRMLSDAALGQERREEGSGTG